jgi:hypothetical protein
MNRSRLSHSGQSGTLSMVTNSVKTYMGRQQEVSQAGERVELDEGIRHRLYLNEVGGRGPRPRRRGGAVMSSILH